MREVVAGGFAEHRQPDIADAVFQYFSTDRLEYDGGACQAVFFGFLAGALNSQRDFAAFLAANLADRFVERHVLGVLPVDFDNQVAAENSGSFGRSPFDRGYDGKLLVLDAKHDTDAAEGAFGLQHQFTVHFGVQIDGVRIAERVDHPFERAGHEQRAFGGSDILALYDLDGPEQFQGGRQFVRTHLGQIVVDFQHGCVLGKGWIKGVLNRLGVGGGCPQSQTHDQQESDQDAQNVILWHIHLDSSSLKDYWAILLLYRSQRQEYSLSAMAKL